MSTQVQEGGEQDQLTVSERHCSRASVSNAPQHTQNFNHMFDGFPKQKKESSEWRLRGAWLATYWREKILRGGKKGKGKMRRKGWGGSSIYSAPRVAR